MCCDYKTIPLVDFTKYLQKEEFFNVTEELLGTEGRLNSHIDGGSQNRRTARIPRRLRNGEPGAGGRGAVARKEGGRTEVLYSSSQSRRQKAERVCGGSGPGSGAQLQNIRGFSHQSSLADPLWAWRTGKIFMFRAQVMGEWFRKSRPSVLNNNVFLLLFIPTCCPEVPCTQECVYEEFRIIC